MGTNIITYGGVSFDKNQVRYMSSTNENGKQQYSVVFNDGTRVRYTDTPCERNASISQEKKGNQVETSFNGLTHAEIKDTPKDDIYKLYGCEFTTVDADTQKYGRSYDSDTIFLADRKMADGTQQYNTGNKIYVCHGDTPPINYGKQKESNEIKKR